MLPAMRQEAANEIDDVLSDDREPEAGEGWWAASRLLSALLSWPIDRRTKTWSCGYMCW